MLESVKKAFILSIKAIKLFYVIAALNIIINLINFLVIPAPVKTEMNLGRSLLVIGLTLLFLLLSIFITAGALAYIKELIKTGSAKLVSFIREGSKYFLRFLALVLIVIVVFLISGILLFAILNRMPDTLKVLRVIITVLFFLILTILVLMSPYALVGSDLGVVGSIKKGILMGLKNFFKILGIIAIMLLVGIVVLIVTGVISGLLSLIFRPMSGYIAAVIMAIASSVMAIFVNIAYMHFYLKNASIENK